MAGKPVGLLSELIVVINDNNDNAVHDVYRTKSWTVLHGGDSNSKDCNNQVFDCTFTFSFLFSIKVSTIIALAHALKTMTTIK